MFSDTIRTQQHNPNFLNDSMMTMQVKYWHNFDYAILEAQLGSKSLLSMIYHSQNLVRFPSSNNWPAQEPKRRAQTVHL